MTRRERMLDGLNQDIREHIERETRDNIARGMSSEEARYAALRKFGNVTQVREETREVWSLRWLEQMLQDFRYAGRMLRKSPGFSAIAILTVALGIGATTAIFSVVDATLLHPLPYPHPEQLVTIQDDLPGVGARDVGMSQPEWEDLQHSGIFEYVSPAWYDDNNLTGASRPARVKLIIVAPDYFAMLGVKPQLGRGFNPEDHSSGILPELVISDSLWKGLFGGDPGILGKDIRMDTDLYHVVGVMPPGFHAPGRTTRERNAEVWAATSFYGAPLSPQPPRNGRNLPTAIARLKPGQTIAQAQSRLDSVVAALRRQYPTDYPAQYAWTVRLVPLKESIFGNIRPSLILLLSAVGLVLLIGCVNVANLLLARASARGREMAVRQALGADRTRLVRQLLTESVLLSLLGGIAGLAILFSVKGLLLRTLPESLPRLNEISISWSVLAFALAASVISGMVFGLAPALHAGRVDLVHSLKQEARGSTGSGRSARTRRMLVVAEFALSLVLMIAAGLVLRSFQGLLNAQLGFNPQSVMTVQTRLPYPNNPQLDAYGTISQEAPFFRETIRRSRLLPGVEEVAMGDVGALPLEHDRGNQSPPVPLIFEGREAQSNEAPLVDESIITPEYFHLMGMTLLRGRLFTELDNDKAPAVAVINEAFARAFLPNEDPLGKHLKVTRRADANSMTIVGVVANARTESIEDANIPQIYADLYQRQARNAKHLVIFLRGHLDTAAIPEEVREQVQAVDPTIPVFSPQTLNETVSAFLAVKRFSMEMVGLFALTALLLAGLGIYGVVSYMVGERTHEIGIRVALGAQRRDITSMVLRQGLRLAIAGAAIGLVCALIVSQLIAGMLYGVRPTDPVTFAGVALLLIGVALVACYLPARRAVRVDPLVALRHE